MNMESTIPITNVDNLKVGLELADMDYSPN